MAIPKRDASDSGKNKKQNRQPASSKKQVKEEAQNNSTDVAIAEQEEEQNVLTTEQDNPIDNPMDLLKVTPWQIYHFIQQHGEKLNESDLEAMQRIIRNRLMPSLDGEELSNVCSEMSKNSAAEVFNLRLKLEGCAVMVQDDEE